MNEIEQLQKTENNPLSRFGHTTTCFLNGKVCLFGGAVGSMGQFQITDNLYTLDFQDKNLIWKKTQTTGISPSARAAHGAVCIENNKMIIYGGATGTGGLASDDLFHLDLKGGVGTWNIININCPKGPGKRYGHTLSYVKPYLIVFGGNIGDKNVNDCWILNIERKPLEWIQIIGQGDSPSPRVYHSATLSKSGDSSGMIVVYGGRGSDSQPLNDTWGLRRHRKGHWDWVRAPEVTSPSPRYQHSSLFIGPLMFIIGGKTNNTKQSLNIQTYDTQTCQWSSHKSLQRFRHSSWTHQKCIYLYGGFQLSSPTVPVDTISKIHPLRLFRNNPSLYNKLAKITKDLNQSFTSVSSNNSNISSKSPRSASTKQTRQRMQSRVLLSQQKQEQHINNRQYRNDVSYKRQQEISQNRQETSKSPKRRIVIMQPVIGNQKLFIKNANKNTPIRRALTSKTQIPELFLNQLMQPAIFKNSQTLKFNLKAQHIIILCDLAQQIIANQPMVLNVKAPLKIFGDIHGQFTDLLAFFNLFGSPHLNGQKKDIQQYDYIFLGDYVDRGAHSLQTICLLLALKVTYPEQIHLIRGNHQDHQINDIHGFMDQCSMKFDEDPLNQQSVYMRLNRLFEWFPLAAVAQNKILCLHGGIGGSVQTIQDINNIQRPLQIMHQVVDRQSQLVLDILWSDPSDSDTQLGISPNYQRDPSQSGNIVKFGPDRVQQFLIKNNLDMVIRAHQCVMDGFQRFAGGKLITVFSAIDYCRRHKNAGAILIVQTNLQIKPKLIYPKSSDIKNWIEDDQQQQKKRPSTPPRWKIQR